MANNYLYNGVVSSTGTGLPGTKADTSNPLTVPANMALRAGEANAITGALADIKTAVLSAINVLAYGADPTGATDSSAAVALAYAAVIVPGTLYFPPGNYRLSTNTTIPAYVDLIFNGSGFSVDGGVTLVILGQVLAPFYAAAPSFAGPGFPIQVRPRTFFNTAAPVTGTFAAGDQVINSAPAAGGNVGWICTAGGSPGTWKQYGLISA